MRALRPSIQLLDASGGGGHNPATGKEVTGQVVTQKGLMACIPWAEETGQS
jgi:LacI family transcriptional regulator